MYMYVLCVCITYYVRMNTCRYVCTVCLRVCLYVCVYVYVLYIMYVFMYCIFVCVYIMYVRNVCMCVCKVYAVCACVMYICVCMCVYIYIYTHTHVCIYIYTHTHTHTHIHIHTYIHYIYVGIYICICVFWWCFCILSLYTAQSQITHTGHSGAAVTWTLWNATITTALYTASRIRSVCLEAQRQWDGSGTYLRKSHLEYFREASEMFEPLQTSQENSVSGFSESRNLLVVVGICESGESVDTEKTRTFAVSLFRFTNFIRPF